MHFPEAGTPAPLAFWCERVTYRSMDADEITDVSRCIAAGAAEAIRAIRRDVRALISVLPPSELRRAMSWVDGGGCVGAMGALHRGEPCGLSLSYDGQWIEWSVRPYRDFFGPYRDRLPLLGSCVGRVRPGPVATALSDQCRSQRRRGLDQLIELTEESGLYGD